MNPPIPWPEPYRCCQRLFRHSDDCRLSPNAARRPANAIWRNRLPRARAAIPMPIPD